MTTALYFTSERKMPRNKWGQWNCCRIIAAMSATGLATANECFLRWNGRHMGISGRVKLATKGLKAADGNWQNDTGFSQADVDEIHKGMFPDLPMPELVGTENWWDLFKHLPERQPNGSYGPGNIINIAVRLSSLPLSDDAAQYTRADHQITLRARKRVNGVWYIKRIDPMRPQNSNYQGDWVKANSIKKAAKDILGGVIVAEIYPDEGGWKRAQLVRQNKNDRIRALNAELEEKDRTIERVRTARDEWRAKFEECDDLRPQPPDDVLNDFIDLQLAWLEDHRP